MSSSVALSPQPFRLTGKTAASMALRLLPGNRPIPVGTYTVWPSVTVVTSGDVHTFLRQRRANDWAYSRSSRPGQAPITGTLGDMDDYVANLRSIQSVWLRNGYAEPTQADYGVPVYLCEQLVCD